LRQKPIERRNFYSEEQRPPFDGVKEKSLIAAAFRRDAVALTTSAANYA